MSPILDNAAEVGRTKHPRSVEKNIQYGTAGFRCRAEDMDFIVYRMGILATLRTCYKKATIGLMITASHNPEADNGVKLIDPLGDMLELSWETYATQLVNVGDTELAFVIQSIMTLCGLIELDPKPANPVYIAIDTRKSSPSLARAATDGAKALNGHTVQYGELTTPQLHYLVFLSNTQGQNCPHEEHYYNKLSKPFKQIRGQLTNSGNYDPTVLVDCANGVGASKLKVLCSTYLKDLLNCIIVNDAQKGGILNHQCGADFVKVRQKVPTVQNGDSHIEKNWRCVSYDGDADRIVYFYIDEDDRLYLMDGDKIATLVASYLVRLLRESGLQLYIGLVQTAYANGNSTDYIENTLQIPVTCTRTGVKHLHHIAKTYDVGVYFEANGHGTVLFSSTAMEEIIKAVEDSSISHGAREAAEKLKFSMDLINQTVGDAISDMLLVETILHHYGWNVQDWNNMYTDLPNRQLKVRVADRTVIQTTDAERKTETPPGLQDAIDTVVSCYVKGRAFTRPSGTEDVVRVYAEADSQVNADALATTVAGLVHDAAGGVGPRPTQDP